MIAFNTYRQLTYNMEKRFEIVTDPEELDRMGRTCIICRDQMDVNGGCVKLPGCGHAFHAHCLREWLVQQQTCPTCRADIAANEARQKRQREREEAAAAAAAAEEAQAADAPEAAAAPAAGDGTGAVPERHRAPDGVAAPQPEQTLAVASPDDVLPAGWSQHAHHGRTYYHNSELGQSTWNRPATSKEAPSNGGASHVSAATHPSPSDGRPSTQAPGRGLAPPPKLATSAGFPCLYRVVFPAGAPVYASPGNGDAPGVLAAAPNAAPRRFVPCGKLVVCTSVEYWPLPFQEAMLRMPEGYVRARDVKRFLVLSKAPRGEGSEETKGKAAVLVR